VIKRYQEIGYILIRLKLRPMPYNLTKRHSLDSLNLYIAASGAHNVRQRGLISCHCVNGPCGCFVALSCRVEMLQQDLNTAAEVGQALLEQHQEYVSKSQQEELRMEREIKTLSAELEAVAHSNETLLTHNAELLQQIHDTSDALEQSDSKLEQLECHLDASKQRIVKLNTYLIQTRALESQVAMLESMRESLQYDLTAVNKDKSLAELRWRKAERALDNLTQQYKQLEECSMLESDPPLNDFTANPSLVSSISQLNKRIFAESTPLRTHVTTTAIHVSQLPTPPSSIKQDRSPSWSHSRNVSVMSTSPSQQKSLFDDPDFRNKYLNGRGLRHHRSTLESPVHSRQSSVYQNDLDHDDNETIVDYRLRRSASHESVLAGVEEPGKPFWGGQRAALAAAQVSAEVTLASHRPSPTSSSKELLSAAIANNVKRNREPDDCSSTSSQDRSWMSLLTRLRKPSISPVKTTQKSPADQLISQILSTPETSIVSDSAMSEALSGSVFD
jgi:hypothetical protein